jgi:excisionase family DNA binding protein
MELLTVRETAAILRVAPITVRRYIATGRLPAVRVGRNVRIDRDALPLALQPVSPARPERTRVRRRVQPFGPEDPIWDLVGSWEDGPTDLSTDKHRYLAEAYEARRA